MIPPLGLLAVTLALFAVVAALGYQAGAVLAPWFDYLAVCRKTDAFAYTQGRRHAWVAAMAWSAILVVVVVVASFAILWLAVP